MNQNQNSNSNLSLKSPFTFTFTGSLAPAFGRHCGCNGSGEKLAALALTADRRPFPIVGLLAFGVL